MSILKTKPSWLIVFVYTLLPLIALAACGAKSRKTSAPGSLGSSPLEVQTQRLTPISKDELPLAKDWLRTLGSTANLEKQAFTHSHGRCKYTESRVRPKIDATKIRVGAQVDFSQHQESQGEGCPWLAVRHLEANMTFWSVDSDGQNGTVRTRAEIRQESRVLDREFHAPSGIRESVFKFRAIEDGRFKGGLRRHLRAFGSGHMVLMSGERVSLRVRVEQLQSPAKKPSVVQIRLKTSTNQNFNYAIQLEELNGEIRIVKAFIGNVQLTEGEVRDLRVAGLVERFLLSIQ